MSMYIPASLAGGRYTVGNLIGHGGMAEVHVGTDTRLGRTVAIKIMRADLAGDAIFLARFRREAHSVAMLNNPNIVSIYDSGEEAIKDDAGRSVNVPYLVMEFVQGRTLRDILKENGSLSQRDAEQVMLGVLSALEYSHRMGIIHRDIKPGNIMISDQGMVKVMDFGIARALDDSSATMTQSQGVVGTAQYLSPEQARGENVDMRSDLYSAGCVLYEMLTGRPPFTGDSAVAIAYQHVSEVATPPSAIVPGLPKLWDSVCAKAMAKDRQNRYTTATEFRNDILALMNGGTPVAAAFNPLTDLTNMKARKESETATMPMTPANGAAETVAFNPLDTAAGDENQLSRSAQRAATAKAKKKKKTIAAIIAVLAVVAIGLGVWFAVQGSKPKMATVPTITEQMSSTLAKEKIESAGFTYVEKQDNDSDKEKGTFTKQSPKGGAQAEEGSTVTVWFSSGPKKVTVPDVKGETQEEAKAELEKLGFKVNGSASVEESADVEKDMVTRTDPASGTTQNKGASIVIYISSGMTTVPDGLTGLSEDQATAKLQAAGLTPTIRTAYSDTVAAGMVLRVDPGSGTKVDQGSSVTMYVSQGKEKVTVPSIDTSGSTTLSSATQQLTAAGFKVSVSGDKSDNAVVTGINPAGGTQVDKGATITLTTKAPSTSSTENSTESPSPTPTDTASGETSQ
ncbi:serine/threonine protein kinase [Bifidobacterium primatium]|uniref:non-specific serine/threonine protein kinase n=2 Tax=Bifidobacterium TaxID=1678 RepID=A0A2M9HBS2_9BIFI|nr:MULTISPECIES: Stk1 family PASTA domain-containing Ser/Thr kinase [Bifidobacterium]NEG95574.1 Stk1 family PASTA domain-containing Ser/Thr kinase [Bifidobacterium sp. SMB2]NEH12488.1 Stk1 family PASTA domain-containing Ser/Thr kinase [Bifidobacterium saimiriisciurei]PJM74258.1 serine/threonine protein kinase [Bifidobacterium primatium]